LAYAEAILDIDRGLIKVDPDTQASSLSKIFAGGDATISGPLSVASAVASGRRAAESINRFLGGRPTRKKNQTEHLTSCAADSLDSSRRFEPPELPLPERCLEKEDVLGINSGAVNSEANRCLNCGCDGVNPSDLAAALVALDASIVTTMRIIPAEKFWTADRGLNPTVLENNEIITEINLPRPVEGAKSAFIKFALRKSIDFPIVNCAAMVVNKNGIVTSSRVCLNAVYCNPYRVIKAETLIQGKKIDEASAEEAGAIAVSDAVALPYNKFKIQIAKTMVKRALLMCK